MIYFRLRGYGLRMQYAYATIFEKPSFFAS